MVDRTSAQAREVAAGVGLGKALAPQFVGAKDARQVTALLLVAAPVDEARTEQVEAARPWQNRGAGADILLVEDDLLHEARTTAAIFLGPRDPDPARGVHRLLPLDALFQYRAVGGDALVGRVVDANLGRQVGLEPAAELAAECRMLRAVGKIHGSGPLLAIETIEAMHYRLPWQARLNCEIGRPHRTTDQ